MAALYGNLELLRAASRDVVGAARTTPVVAAAVIGGHVDVLRYLVKKYGYKLKAEHAQLAGQFSYGRRDMLEWLLSQHSAPLDVARHPIESGRHKEMMLTAALEGAAFANDGPTLEWLISLASGANVNPAIPCLSGAAKAGNTSLLRALLARGYTCDRTVMTAAAIGDSVECIKLLLGSGVESYYSFHALEAAACSQSVSAFRYLFEDWARMVPADSPSFGYLIEAAVRPIGPVGSTRLSSVQPILEIISTVDEYVRPRNPTFGRGFWRESFWETTAECVGSSGHVREVAPLIRAARKCPCHSNIGSGSRYSHCCALRTVHERLWTGAASNDQLSMLRFLSESVDGNGHFLLGDAFASSRSVDVADFLWQKYAERHGWGQDELARCAVNAARRGCIALLGWAFDRCQERSYPVVGLLVEARKVAEKTTWHPDVVAWVVAKLKGCRRGS
jgi:hypothetical protein